jgi:hypothetical protein
MNLRLDVINGIRRLVLQRDVERDEGRLLVSSFRSCLPARQAKSGVRLNLRLDIIGGV